MIRNSVKTEMAKSGPPSTPIPPPQQHHRILWGAVAAASLIAAVVAPGSNASEGGGQEQAQGARGIERMEDRGGRGDAACQKSRGAMKGGGEDKEQGSPIEARGGFPKLNQTLLLDL